MVADIVDQETIAATERERAVFAELERLLTAPGQEPRLVVDGQEVPLPASLHRLVTLGVRSLGHGQPVTVIPGDRLLTTQEAANVLRVSRPYLVRLLNRNEIPFTKVGTRRRLAVSDVAAYKERRSARRRMQLDALAQLTQDLGLYGAD
jgi:excisionase family DNA binding protein